MRLSPSLSGALGGALLSALMLPAASADEKPEFPEAPSIEGFQQLMPRGGIPAIFDPVFVEAADAEMPDDAWILGFESDGVAYAYDLNLLNRHEVVNHGSDGAEFAAVW